MLPSVISNLIWGCSPQREEPEQEPKVNVTAQEETGDWLLISCQNSCGEWFNCVLVQLSETYGPLRAVTLSCVVIIQNVKVYKLNL